MPRLALACLFLPLALAACATLNQDQCVSGDWREIGQRDGQNGRTADYIAQHVKACAEYGVTPDRTAWEQGRKTGLTAYCTPARAYDEGRDGRSLSPVCPASSLPALTAAHAKGREYLSLTNQIRELRDEISDLNREMATADPAQRARIFARINMLNARLMTVEARRQAYTWP
ncbi:DUF2799 domain-containing protein [Thetidibacter halocola]|uniref:DUF2799 domain-containing protein n=1 Tax=Thetidibacter halocola TaxID=2827239 RepID=A0A8J7WJT3_9RHOB|nr:DUF2799 domain-containing protein [Thetidibacter halocola]MBS0126623.1 DUF2799 domain-containing protein [Thetidibacter halocola]